jgi:aspartyl-tRNA(Asn)/glutamyl-tRNA(Gln) amidotransferase subunit A
LAPWHRGWRGGLRIALIRRQGFDAPLDAEGHAALELAARALEAAGAIIEEAEPELPDVRHIFGRVWGVALARLVASVPEEKRELLDAGIAAIAEREARMSAVDFLAAEALRIEAATPWPASTSASTRADALHADRRLRRRPADAARPPGPVARLGALDLRLQPDRQPAISVPVGLDAEGMPRAVQVTAALYRDDTALRVARALELAVQAPCRPRLVASAAACLIPRIACGSGCGCAW